ncbi:hypothetical protein COLO4_04536 [Corchorus olitorius]|uniref:Uncharacterized protein n=1 Tax=Corchorus olitorius TaxID=93759 RepID=A0A1R3KTJ7_9ROSI|nr:hypothetical protein COLO4_04536 [Corchorus olitorius]
MASSKGQLGTPESLYKYKSPTEENKDCSSRGAIIYTAKDQGCGPNKPVIVLEPVNAQAILRQFS